MESIFNILERAFNLLDTPKEILRLIILGAIAAIGTLIYQVIQSNYVIDQLVEPKIIRFNQYCYQQNVRLNATIIGIQFPVTDIQREAGVKQNIAAFLMDRTNISAGEFREICDLMKANILDPEAEDFLLFTDPAYSSVLIDHYSNLFEHSGIGDDSLSEDQRVLDSTDFPKPLPGNMPPSPQGFR